MSVVTGHMIVSPPAKEIIPGVMCKVKGFEKYLSKVVAAGTKAEMNSKLDMCVCVFVMRWCVL